MNKSGFFLMFSALSFKERKAFRLFLTSPYHNRRDELILLHDFLEEVLSLQLPLPDKKKLYQKIWQDQSYEDLKLRHTLSYFKKALEKFYALQDWEEDPLDQALRLTRTLRKTELHTLYERQVDKSFDMLEKAEFRDLNYHYTQYQLFLERYEYAHREKRGGSMFLQEQTDALTIFYISGVLRQSCIILSHQNLNPRQYKQILLDSVMEEVQKGNLLNIPAIAIYYYNLLALSESSNSDSFEKMVMLIDQHWRAFRNTEIRDIYILAINYCIKRLNQGNRDFVQKAFDLYKSGLDRGCLLENGQISPFAYKNVLMLGMSLQEHQWVEHFLHSYKKYLAPDIRDNTYNYNLAIYYFRKPDYDQAQQLLHRVEFKDVLNNLDARRMLLRIYYETQAYEALDSHLDSFRQYIHRQKDIGYHRESYLRLIKFVKKTLRTNLNSRELKLALKKEITEAEPFVEQNWLVQQI